MRTEVRPIEYANKALEILQKGAFLTTAVGDKINTMTIGWGNIGIVWQKPVFMVMVRHSRYTYELIEKSSEFTVSIPINDMKAALAVCGTKSGRDVNKIELAGIRTLPGQKVSVPVIAGAGLHFECKAVYKQKMEADLLDAGYHKMWYQDEDYHTMYYGEIVACYVE